METGNVFQHKMKGKSDKQLHKILTSDHHVDDAKIAAKIELERRSQNLDSRPSEHSSKEKSIKTVDAEKINRKKYYERRFLLFGITCLFSAGIYFLPDLITSKKSLIQLSGTISNCNVFIENVSSKNRFGYESKSRKATLSFHLKENNKVFRLSENIGQEYSHLEYNRLLRKLRNSNQVAVWITSSDSQNLEPKVFQLDIDNKTEIDFDELRFKNRSIFILLLFLGIGSVTIVLRRKYPEKMKSIIGV